MSDSESKYATVIGKRAEYYLPKFQSYDGAGSLLSWNWPAFFVTSGWFLYRKMYLAGALCAITIPLVLLGLTVAASAVLGPDAAWIAGLVLLLLESAIAAVLANALYWRHVRKTIEDAPRNLAASDLHQELARRGGASMRSLLLLSAGLLVPLGGGVAAVSIPAYQDYVLRSQVVEGLNIASPYKAEIAGYWMQNQRWPETDDLSLGQGVGLFVDSVTVEGGSVVIRFGGAAQPPLQGKFLILVPGITSEGELAWACGRGDAPQDVEYALDPYGTDIEDRHLPQSCRMPD